MARSPQAVSVIGLGKLGAVLAAAFAYRGFNVVGVDTHKKVVDRINAGKAPVVEPRLNELIQQAKSRLRATTDIGEALQHTDMSFLLVPTPSDESGSFSDLFLTDALRALSRYLRRKKTHHSIVVTSTVMPTTIEKRLIPFIEEQSGKALHDGWSMCYNPEFLALGNAVEDILNPDMVLIGESGRAAGDELEAVYKEVCENSPPIMRMSIVSAETAKIALNAYVSMKISFANTLGNICERVPGADADAVTTAIGADKRVSPYYFKAGLAFGGPCFPRDNRAFYAAARQFGLEAPLARAADAVNDFQTDNLFNRIRAIIEKEKYGALSIVGLSYKPHTPVIEESAAVSLIEKLLREFRELKIFVYDSLALEEARRAFGDRISYERSLRKCVSRAPLVVVASPEKEFGKIQAADVTHTPKTIIDCWRVLDPARLGGQVRYLALGQNLYEDG